jgi:coenzyme F420-reducing hydrogenase gamma subunit
MSTSTVVSKPTIAVFKFSSCDGCQLSLLDCEDEILGVVGAVQILEFKELTRTVVEGPYDVSFVEGSITTPDDAERIRLIRQASGVLVTIGACATSGGIQALRNYADVGDFTTAVYAHPEYISTLAQSTGIADHVPVDFELRGCPIDRYQLLEVITATLNGRKPVIPGHTVCQQCKARGTVCYGCFGPSDSANTSSLARQLNALGTSRVDVSRLFRTFNAGAPAFREESLRYDSPETGG